MPPNRAHMWGDLLRKKVLSPAGGETTRKGEVKVNLYGI